MRAREIMTRSVVTVRSDTTVQHAAALLSEHGITSVPVLDEDDRVIGILSEVDVIRNRMPHDPRSHLRPETHQRPDPGHLVRDVMNNIVICLGENADIADLAALMLDNNLRAIPIVDGAHLVGIVSRRDLLRTLIRDDDLVRAEVVQRLDDFAGEGARWKVAVDEGVVRIAGHFDDASQRESVMALARTVPGVLRVQTDRHRL
ncbi:MAG: CBS domain-containing protein [Pseudonocardiales bacterium]|nr:MAG: CBS domain-containing protein [Pseudonocardiales bacterium]